MWACYKGRTEVVEVLLSHGANPSVTGLVGGDTVVTRSPVEGGDFLRECFRLLCFRLPQRGLDVRSQSALFTVETCKIIRQNVISKRNEIFFHKQTYFSVFTNQKATPRA